MQLKQRTQLKGVKTQTEETENDCFRFLCLLYISLFLLFDNALLYEDLLQGFYRTFHLFLSDAPSL